MNMLSNKDQGRLLTGPFQLGFDITNRCNYRCKHCYNASGENAVINDELSDEEVLNFIYDISKVKLFNICFCGGEPLLRKDLICKCADILYQNGTTSISMVSNGYYLTDEIAEELKSHHVNRIQISLDGASEETCYKLRGNKLAFSKAVNALRILDEHGFKDMNIAFCPTKFNINELDDVCEICNELNVTEIRLQPLMLSGRARVYKDDILPTKEQYIELLRKINKLNKKYMLSNLKLSWGDPLDHIFRYKGKLKDVNTYATVKANGDIPISPYLPLSVGNIKRHKFSEYWENNLANAWSLEIVRNLADNIVCIEDMGKKIDDFPDTWWDNDMQYDLIDEVMEE